MLKNNFQLAAAVLVLAFSQIVWAKEVPVDQKSVSAGESISVQGVAAQLYAGSLKVGDNLLDVARDTGIGLPFDHRVTIVSTVPSIDTPVCELQTNQLALSKEIAPDIDVITISRDLPFAQERFAKNEGLSRMKFVSDYKTGGFGRRSGLMIKGKELLARSLIVLDRDGVIRYIQVVPELSHLPDIARAIGKANDIARSK